MRLATFLLQVLRYQSSDEVKGIFKFLLSIVSEMVIVDQSHDTRTSIFLCPNEKSMMPLGNFRESSGCIKEASFGKGVENRGKWRYIFRQKLYCFRFLWGKLISSLPSKFK